MKLSARESYFSWCAFPMVRAAVAAVQNALSAGVYYTMY